MSLWGFVETSKKKVNQQQLSMYWPSHVTYRRLGCSVKFKKIPVGMHQSSSHSQLNERLDCERKGREM